MKLREIFVLFTLSAIVKGIWLAAVAQPVILGLGALLAALDLDVLDLQTIKWNNWFSLTVDDGKTLGIGNGKKKEDDDEWDEEKTEYTEEEEKAFSDILIGWAEPLKDFPELKNLRKPGEKNIFDD